VPSGAFHRRRERERRNVMSTVALMINSSFAVGLLVGGLVLAAL
jgi:hypothetical protein